MVDKCLRFRQVELVIKHFDGINFELYLNKGYVNKSMAAAVDSESVIKKFTLNNGILMPAVGLGTFRIRNTEEVIQVVDHALSAGYRMFDTAAVYRNESHLREAFHRLLPQHNLGREDIFITTKLSSVEHGTPELIRKSYNTSISNLGFDFADLYLMHFPVARKPSVDDKASIELQHATWRGMAELYDNGHVSAIGVSNFNLKQLKVLMERNHGVVPAINQVEMHPFFYQMDMLDYCKANDIIVQAYCSLGGTSVNYEELLTHPSITKIAKSLDVTNSQVLLRWALQQDISVIPKSTDPMHIKQNISLNFDISPEDMQILGKLSKTRMRYADTGDVV